MRFQDVVDSTKQNGIPGRTRFKSDNYQGGIIKENYQTFLDEKQNITQILSLDGGGLRGYLSATILEDLEKDIKSKNLSALCEIFQGGISGTSTGSFIALALASPWHRNEENNWEAGPYSAQEIGKLYQNMSQIIFEEVPKKKCLWCCLSTFCCCCRQSLYKGLTGPKYTNNRLQEQLTHYFGDMTLGDTFVPVTISALSFANNPETKRTEGKMVYFSSYEHRNLLMKDVALASSAAPTFFPSVTVNFNPFDKSTTPSVYIDGGIGDNSPVLAGLNTAVYHTSKVREQRHESRSELSDNLFTDYTVLSLGTGNKGGGLERNVLDGKTLSLVGPLIENIISASGDSKHLSLEQVFASFNNTTEKYFRAQPTLVTQYGMDDHRILKDLETAAKSYLDKDNSSYKTFKNQLLQKIQLYQNPRVIPLFVGEVGAERSQQITVNIESKARALRAELPHKEDRKKLAQMLLQNSERSSQDEGGKIQDKEPSYQEGADMLKVKRNPAFKKTMRNSSLSHDSMQSENSY